MGTMGSVNKIKEKLNGIINELNEEADQLQAECDEKSGVRIHSEWWGERLLRRT